MTDIIFNRWGSLDEAIAHYRSSLDEKAGEVRRRFARDWLIDEEYTLSAEQAQAFVDGGYSGDAPESVQAWADAAGMTAKGAADDILATRDAYNVALQQVRRARLTGKESIKLASTAREARQIHDQAYADLDAIKP